VDIVTLSPDPMLVKDKNEAIVLTPQSVRRIATMITEIFFIII
jgi:hypothetical protein